jgi:hypothetical protein
MCSLFVLDVLKVKRLSSLCTHRIRIWFVLKKKSILFGHGSKCCGVRGPIR